MANIIIGRKNVIKIANEHINKLISRIEEIIRGSEQEYLLHLVCLYPELFAELAKKIVENGDKYTYNITWLRAATGFTLALNRILPEHLPLKHISTLNVKKFEKTTANLEEYLKLILISHTIGTWQYILENKYINKIKIEIEKIIGETVEIPRTYYTAEKESLYRRYMIEVFKFYRTEEYKMWFNIIYREKFRDSDLIKFIDNYLFENYGFYLDDLVGALLYLEHLTEQKQPYFDRNKIHEVFTKNIRSGRAEKLLKALTFDKDKDLQKSPLIPVKGGYYLIAGWVFKLRMHIYSWIHRILEQKQNYSKFAEHAGRLFEEYVKKQIEGLVDEIRLNVSIRECEYPEIRQWLDEMGKKGEFEIDIFAIKGDTAFIISCKGGRKELPRLMVSKMWGEIPEKDIQNRIEKNKKDIKELRLICACIMSSDSILRSLGISGKKVEPLVVYPLVQPLSVPELRAVELGNVHQKLSTELETLTDPKIVTVGELESIIKKVR